MRITVLLVDRGELAAMAELPEAAFLHEPGEVRVGFGAPEVVDVDSDAHDRYSLKPDDR